TQITIDLDSSNTAFDDDLDLQEEIELVDEPEMLKAKNYLIDEYEMFRKLESTSISMTQMDSE
ncbi:25129_t:CDS:2, partial [Dentiscutata erythropus]